MEKEMSRYERGLAKLAEVDAKVGEELLAPLGDLGRYIAEFAYGDILSRDGLSLREREMIVVAVLTALGQEPQLKVHLGAALNAGATVRELEEVIIQTAPYAGFPTSINAMNLLKQLVSSPNELK